MLEKHDGLPTFVGRPYVGRVPPLRKTGFLTVARPTPTLPSAPSRTRAGRHLRPTMFVHHHRPTPISPLPPLPTRGAADFFGAGACLSDGAARDVQPEQNNLIAERLKTTPVPRTSDNGCRNCRHGARRGIAVVAAAGAVAVAKAAATMWPEAHRARRRLAMYHASTLNDTYRCIASVSGSSTPPKTTDALGQAGRHC